MVLPQYAVSIKKIRRICALTSQDIHDEEKSYTSYPEELILTFCIKMESLTEVSEYLNNLEAMMKDDEFNSIERMEGLVKKEKEELETKAMEEDDFVHYEPEMP
ncbi:hypothetical protein Tco_0308101 [Tanacetum coccineum]